MDIKKIRVGMKVTPHDKTADGRGKGLKNSVVWQIASERQQPFLYVISKIKDDCYPEIVLSDTQNDIGGDYFLPSDFEKFKRTK